jgi:hypothetical protein
MPIDTRITEQDREAIRERARLEHLKVWRDNRAPFEILNDMWVEWPTETEQ